jgi:hypothetical protein
MKFARPTALKLKYCKIFLFECVASFCNRIALRMLPTVYIVAELALKMEEAEFLHPTSRMVSFGSG